MNPPGEWKFRGYDTHYFVNHSIGAVYGVVKREERQGFDQPWYWEARVLLDARKDVSKPISGYAPTEQAAKTIVETLLRETLTCEFPQSALTNIVDAAERLLEDIDDWGEPSKGNINRLRQALENILNGY